MRYALLRRQAGPLNATPGVKRAQQAVTGQRLKAKPLGLIQRCPVGEVRVRVGQHGVGARGHENLSRCAPL